MSDYRYGRTLEERFWSRVDASGDCWEWTGLKSMGYGRIGRHSKAHRVAWELLVGPIPNGLHIDHLCRNHGCVNPDHMEPVTQRLNTLRGFGACARFARRTHCLHGHPLEGSNLILVTSRKGTISRACRVCRQASNQRTAASRRLREAGNQ